MPGARRGFGRRVAFALDGADVEEDGAVGVPRYGQGVHQRAEIVPVYGADIAEAEGLDEPVADKEALQGVLDRVVGATQGVEVQLLRNGLDGFLDAVVAAAGKETSEVTREGPDVLRDGHLVVVEDDDEATCRRGDAVERLKGETV